MPRAKVPQFYADFYNKPSAVNHGHTINGYWMEQSRGLFGITQARRLRPLPHAETFWEYGLNEMGQNMATPTGERADGNLERDADAAWQADQGANISTNYRRPSGAVLRIYAGYDETGVWQEFGEMKFETRDDIPAAWGNPNTNLPRWVVSRYVPWTSWLAGAQHWGAFQHPPGRKLRHHHPRDLATSPSALVTTIIIPTPRLIAASAPARGT